MAEASSIESTGSGQANAAQIFVFGGNKHGQCGIEGDHAPLELRLPQRVLEKVDREPLSVAAGASHTVVLLGAGPGRDWDVDWGR